jgi:tetratricopeptide (TPR) repeat protein
MCLVLILGALGGVTGRACLWDRDTVRLETKLFPGVLEVMTGKFPRHSAEFYQWREATLRKQLADRPGSPALLDDLAVAVHKLGRHQEAINLMQASLKQVPGRYETLSNLGTFAIYGGDLPASRAYLRQALAINPDAHFGRERYQLWLVEQLMLKKDAGAFPEMTAGFSEATVKTLQSDYARFIQLQINLQDGWARDGLMRELTVEEQTKAIQGVAGMMRFADFDNPQLQSALGDLLSLQTTNSKAPQLAALAYESALMKIRDPAEREELVARKLRALPGQSSKEMRLKLVEKLDTHLADGRLLAAQVRADELDWIRDKRDVEREFELKYLQAQPLVSLPVAR